MKDLSILICIYLWKICISREESSVAVASSSDVNGNDKIKNKEPVSKRRA